MEKIYRISITIDDKLVDIQAPFHRTRQAAMNWARENVLSLCADIGDRRSRFIWDDRFDPEDSTSVTSLTFDLCMANLKTMMQMFAPKHTAVDDNLAETTETYKGDTNTIGDYSRPYFLEWEIIGYELLGNNE